MNTLDDLRNVLAHEAGAAPTGHHVDRVATVRRRASTHRRRQRAAAAFVAVAAVGAGTLFSQLPDDSSTPVADTVFGIDVPQSMDSLGWRYELDSVETSDSSTAEVELPASDHPRLVSWATRGDDDRVEVTMPGQGPTYVSEAGDFDDFVLLPADVEVTVSVDANDGGVALATYDLDTTRTPEGVGEGKWTFRERAGGSPLLGADVGEPGQTSLSVDLDVPNDPEGEIGFAHTCTGAPRGTQVHIGIEGEEGSLVFGACSGPEFDPGGHISSRLSIGEHAGRQVSVEMWLTRDGARLEDAPGVRVGLGVYDMVEGMVEGSDNRFAETLESGGKMWQLTELKSGRGAVEMAVPVDGTWLVAGGTDNGADLRVLADGEDVAGFSFASGIGGVFHEVRLPAGTSTVRLEAAPRERQGLTLVLYRMEHQGDSGR